MTNYEVLKKLGLNLSPAGIATLMANADIICCGRQPAEGNRCGRHNGMCDECVPVWLEEESSPSMLQLLNEQEEMEWEVAKDEDAWPPARCPKCHTICQEDEYTGKLILSNFCPECGQKLKSKE